MSEQYKVLWQQIKDDPSISKEDKAKFEAMANLDTEVTAEQIDAYKLMLKAQQFYYGDQVAIDQKKAFDVLLEAVGKGSSDAYMLYPVLNQHCADLDRKENEVSVFHTIEEHMGENDDYPTPIWAYLSYAYAYGVGTEVNEEKALKYWKKAWRIYSLQFDAGGFVGFMMGQMAEQKPYLKSHLGEAMNYYKIATRADENNIPAQQAILKLLKTNKKFEDLTYEIELFEETENAKHDKDPKSAYFTLSELYAQKQWKIYNPQLSMQWLTKAAEAGHERAQLNLPLYYEQGNLVKADSKKAMALYQQYYDQGNTLVGIYYLDRLENGTKNIAKNPEKAKEVRKALTQKYHALGHAGDIPKPDELRLLQRMY
ncbi:sel1 repeat family protein [Acinetobacter sp. 194]|uniref:tetratricopeptide repeat protein n=1 Tax=Acinetobacter shaoyimingii TaxID=2715164 RepID=UPI00140C9908|nr:SEL1-like repeat protein [Acinetobacter shaoyimingii]NHB58017.1 sel1 repeat family protein [Acinetobacter shaoyimingii]